MVGRTTMGVWLLVAALLLVAGPANSAVLFNTFGPGDSYNANGGYTIGGPSGQEWDQGNQFMVTGSQAYLLDTIEVAMAQAPDGQGQPIGPDEIDVWLMSDAAGEPGSIIEAFHFVDQMGLHGQYNPLLVGVSTLRPVLDPGTPYWLIASAPDEETWAAWGFSSPDVLGVRAHRDGAVP